MRQGGERHTDINLPNACRNPDCPLPGAAGATEGQGRVDRIEQHHTGGD